MLDYLATVSPGSKRAVCSSARRVRSEFSAAATSSGFASSSSLSRFSLIESVDESGDGVLDFKEFTAICRYVAIARARPPARYVQLFL